MTFLLSPIRRARLYIGNVKRKYYVSFLAYSNLYLYKANEAISSKSMFFCQPQPNSSSRSNQLSIGCSEKVRFLEETLSSRMSIGQREASPKFRELRGDPSDMIYK